MKKLFLIVLALLFVISCATTRPTREQIQAADCGRFPSTYEEVIKNLMSSRLFDPYSAVYFFTKPEKGWNNIGREPIFGWRFCGTINSKNRFGGYVGAKPFYAMIKNDQVVRFIYEGFTIPDSFLLGMLSASMTANYNRDPNSFISPCGIRLVP